MIVHVSNSDELHALYYKYLKLVETGEACTLEVVLAPGTYGVASIGPIALDLAPSVLPRESKIDIILRGASTTDLTIFSDLGITVVARSLQLENLLMTQRQQTLLKAQIGASFLMKNCVVANNSQSGPWGAPLLDISGLSDAPPVHIEFTGTAFVRNATAAPSAMLAIRPGANSSLASVRFVSSMLLDNTGFADLAITGTRTIEIVSSFLYKPQVAGGKSLPLLTYASPQRLVIAHSSVILSRLADLAIENPPAQKPVPVTLRDSGLYLLDEAPGEGKSAALQLEQTQAQVVPKRPAENELKLVLQEYSHALPGTLAASRLATAFGLSVLNPSGG